MAIDTALDLLLHNGRGVVEASGKIFGVVPAIVVAVHDDKGPKRHMMGVVQLYFPWLQTEKDQNRIAPWARVGTIGSGCAPLDGESKGSPPEKAVNAGFHCYPQLGDEVLVAFEHGDIHNPYVLGSLWNGKSPIPLPITDNDGKECAGYHPGGPVHKTPDLAPNCLGGDGGKNKVYFWRSRTGNLVILDDAGGTVRICDKTGKSVIQLEGSEVKILQKDGKGIYFFAEKTIKLECDKFEVHTKGSITMEAGSNLSVSAGCHVTMDAAGNFYATAGTGMGFKSMKDLLLHTNEGGIDMNAMMDVNVKAQKDVKVESAAKIELSGLMEVGLSSDQKINFKSSSGINFTTLMELNLKSGGNIDAKGSMIMMN